MDLQQEQAAWKLRVDMQHEHTTRSCSMNMQLGHAAETFSVNMTWTYRMYFNSMFFVIAEVLAKVN